MKHTIKLPGTPVTDGDLMLEVNALSDKFCISFQLVSKDRKPAELFCELLEQEGVPYSISERFTRYMPKIQLPYWLQPS